MVGNYNYIIAIFKVRYIRNDSLLMDVNGGKANGERDHPQVAFFGGAVSSRLFGIGFPTVSTR